jgi:hypothetical protein
MAAWTKKIKSPTLIFFSCMMVLSVIIAILSEPYFTKRVFHLGHDEYTFESEQGNFVNYHSGTSAPVQVLIDDRGRTVFIDHKKYSITEIDSTLISKYDVKYPNGRNYEVQDQSGYLLSFDEKSEIVSDIQFYVNNERVIQEGEEKYSPAMLVTVAYPKYHYTRGTPELLFLALALLIYGWCGYRYQKIQDIMFFFSLRWIWVNDPDPSDFYYFMCKVGGIISMTGAVLLAFKAF